MTQSPLSVATLRSGIFRFQVAVEPEQTALVSQRVEDAQRFLNRLPFTPEVEARLTRESIASGIRDHARIDDVDTDLAHIFQLMDSQTPAIDANDIRLVNFKETFEEIDRISSHGNSEETTAGTAPATGLVLNETLIKRLHTLLTQRLAHPFNQPGVYRDNAMGQITKVGTLEHGGIYTPPKCREDIELLMRHFLDWINSPAVIGLSPLLRAPLAHYYFLRIHPFWEGNNRVGRALELAILNFAGYRYTYYALGRHYQENREQYLTLFNPARKAEERHPNTAPVQFFLQGMLEAVNRVYERATRVIARVLFENRVDALLKNKKINARQHTIMRQILLTDSPAVWSQLQEQEWYQTLYQKQGPKMRSRDLLGLAEHQLAALNDQGQLKPLLP